MHVSVQHKGQIITTVLLGQQITLKTNHLRQSPPKKPKRLSGEKLSSVALAQLPSQRLIQLQMASAVQYKVDRSNIMHFRGSERHKNHPQTAEYMSRDDASEEIQTVT